MRRRQIRPERRPLPRGVAVAVTAVPLSAARSRPPQHGHEAEPRRLLDPAGRLRELIPMFQKTPNGDGVSFTQSYGASGDQTRAVIAGLECRHRRALARARHGPAREGGHRQPELEEAVVQGHRHGLGRRVRRPAGEPEAHQDLERPPAPGRAGRHAEPVHLGRRPLERHGRLRLLAEAGQDRRAGPGQPAQAVQERRRPGQERARLCEHVPLREGRRAALVRERGTRRAEEGPEPSLRHPEDDDPDREPDRRHQGRAHAAKANQFLRFLRTPAAQQVFADWGYRPVVPKVLAANRKKFPVRPGQFTIDQLGLGGWDKVQKRFFDPKSGDHGPIERKVGRRHWLASAVSQPRARAGSEGQGWNGPVPRLRHDVPHRSSSACRSRRSCGRRRAPGRRASGTPSRAPEAVAALKLTLGTVGRGRAPERRARDVTAWVLVRDDFRGKAVVNAIIDLPFALPTIVAGLTLLALYGPRSPIGIDVAYTRAAIVLAMMFVTLPFVVRTVQPVLAGARPRRSSRPPAPSAPSEADVRARIVFPNIFPGILSGDGARVREGRRRVRGARDHHRQPSVQDRGLVRLHLRPHRERRHGRRCGRRGRPARRSRSSRSSRSA